MKKERRFPGRSAAAIVLAGLLATAVSGRAEKLFPGGPERDWRRYVLSRADRELLPVAVVGDGGKPGEIEDPGLLLARDGRAATLRKMGDEGPEIVLDFSRVVEGRLKVTVMKGRPSDLVVETSECRRFLGLGLATGTEEPARAFRYVRVALASRAARGASVRLDSVSVDREGPGGPGSYSGWFLSSDERLNRIWYAGAYTVELCRGQKEGDVLFDGAKRDREIWTADLAIALRIWGDFQRDWSPVRNSLRMLVRHQRDDGRIPASSMNEFGTFLFDYTAWWVIGLRDYVLRSGDVSGLEEMLPRIGRALAWYEPFTGPDGLLRKPGGEMEWCYTLSREGAIAYENELLVRAYGAAEDLNLWTGHEVEARMWGERGREHARAIGRARRGRESSDLLAGESDGGRLSLDGAILASVDEAGPTEERAADGASALLSAIRQRLWTGFGTVNVDLPYENVPGPEHNGRVWPWLVYLEAEARFEAGRDGEALDLVRRTWGNMLDQDPASTFWEWVGPDGRPERAQASLAHAWSAGATALLSEWVLGVRAVKPGHYRVEPHPGDLTWAEGQVPAGEGEIRVSWRRPPKGEPELKVEAVGGATVVEVRDDALKGR